TSEPPGAIESGRFRIGFGPGATGSTRVETPGVDRTAAAGRRAPGSGRPIPAAAQNPPYGPDFPDQPRSGRHGPRERIARGIPPPGDRSSAESGALREMHGRV